MKVIRQGRLRYSHLQRIAQHHQVSDVILFLTTTSPSCNNASRPWGGWYFKPGSVLQGDLVDEALLVVYASPKQVFPRIEMLPSGDKIVKLVSLDQLTAYIFGHELGHHVLQKRGKHASLSEEQALCDEFSLRTYEEIWSQSLERWPGPGTHPFTIPASSFVAS